MQNSPLKRRLDEIAPLRTPSMGIFCGFPKLGRSTETKGFKHGTRLEIGQVTAIFQLPDATEVQLRVRICWMRRLDNHWFISGGQIVDVVEEEPNYWPVALTVACLVGLFIVFCVLL